MQRITYYWLRDFRDLFVHGLPVIAYHSIDRQPYQARFRSLYLRPSAFERQLRELAACGFHTVSLDDASPEVYNTRREIVLTFDDGYESVASNAAPILKKYGFSAIVYLVASQIGGANVWDMQRGEQSVRLMTKVQIDAWLAAGHQIGSHTLSHANLLELSRTQRHEEIASSKKRLEDTFGIPVNHFSYPYGSWTAEIADQVAEAGYLTACTMDIGVTTARGAAYWMRRIESRHPRRNLKWILMAMIRALDHASN